MPIQRLPPGTGAGKIRKRIRDTQRLLRKPGLSATKKAEAERALAAFEQDMQRRKAAQTEKKLAQKYHMVRFFERKKAFRNLRSRGPDALIDWYYVTMFPRSQKYVSLYAEGAAGRSHEFYSELEQKVADGSLASDQAAVDKILASKEAEGDRKKS